MLLVGRDRGQEGVVESVIQAQERVATAAGEFFRRSANEAVEDAVTASRQLVAAPDAPMDGTLDQMLSDQERWTSLAVVNAVDGEVVASTEDPLAATILGTEPDDVAGVTVVEVDGDAVLVAHAPMERPGEERAVLVGRLGPVDPRFDPRRGPPRRDVRDR